MTCSAGPPGIENGQVVTFDSTQCTAVYSCDTGYAMVGSGVLVYPTGSPPPAAAAWSGSAQCELSFINNGKCLNYNTNTGEFSPSLFYTLIA